MVNLVKYCPVVEKGLSHWTDIGSMVFKASSNFFNRLGILTGLPIFARTETTLWPYEEHLYFGLLGKIQKQRFGLKSLS